MAGNKGKNDSNEPKGESPSAQTAEENRRHRQAARDRKKRAAKSGNKAGLMSGSNPHVGSTKKVLKEEWERKHPEVLAAARAAEEAEALENYVSTERPIREAIWARANNMARQQRGTRIGVIKAKIKSAQAQRTYDKVKVKELNAELHKLNDELDKQVEFLQKLLEAIDQFDTSVTEHTARHKAILALHVDDNVDKVLHGIMFRAESQIMAEREAAEAAHTA